MRDTTMSKALIEDSLQADMLAAEPGARRGIDSIDLLLGLVLQLVNPQQRWTPSRSSSVFRPIVSGRAPALAPPVSWSPHPGLRRFTFPHSRDGGVPVLTNLKYFA